MITLPTQFVSFDSLASFWWLYDLEAAPETIRFAGYRRSKHTIMTCVRDSHKGWMRVAGCDWGRAPLSNFEACPVVQTAAIMLLDATRQPEACLLAAEFAGEVLRTFGDTWSYSAKGVADWYRAELNDLREDAEASFVLEETTA